MSSPALDLDLIYRCENEQNDCRWTTHSFAEIDAHELLPGHWVTGYMEPIAKDDQ